MKTIGLIGGMSWESTVLYYQLINRMVNYKLGASHSAKLVMYSVDFEELAKLQRADRWDQAADMMVEAARNLQNAGADMVLICANTMHKVAVAVASHVTIPLIHIGDATADVIKKSGIKKVGLLGTRYTMEQEFLKESIRTHGLEVIVPEDQVDRDLVHEVIYSELAKGIINDESRRAYLSIMEKMAANGADGIILGCTEIGMLIKPEHTPITLFDTTVIHAEKAVSEALA
ncbi:aspartate/glutamate racemase family protein [Mucilaginibacter sp. KACC 22063]|uniref:aspartate/glutamate racemase family protein n=1 Tax=Mucilaginibacter sp. KACC 22063 TaxID=3025666 RepID=UPI002365B7D2|nr:aspartate/glutamate racemase family protein [Mucilaginibacter sp. KACC 22063]WDF56740.1 aspartate/glutamate racemase family protein [Mucilaginibacter sp. KACC 22063]